MAGKREAGKPPMKAIHSPFTKIINGTTQFVVPVFQRDYRWSESQCEQLWNDVLRIAKDPATGQHFSAGAHTVDQRSSMRFHGFGSPKCREIVR